MNRHTMPRQRPHRSEQSVATPSEFLQAAKDFLGIDEFSIDLAASDENAVCADFLTEAVVSLAYPWATVISAGRWAWLNPPYTHIGPWVQKAYEESRKLRSYGGIAVLVPASTGANWWRDWVHMRACVLLLNGRITFVGHTGPYPKDLALLVYSRKYSPGYDVWSWKREQT